MPRQSRDITEERRRQIIDGALEVFATKGFVHATNKEVAKAAGINSPGLIYHYFQSKEDLLRAVLERHAPPLQLVANAASFMDLPPEEALQLFGNAYLGVMDSSRTSAFLRLFIGEVLRSPKLARLFGEIGPLRFLGMLSDYMRRQMERGLLRPADPGVAARCFLGPLVTYVLTRRIFQIPDAQGSDTAEIVGQCVDVFLNGMRPGSGSDEAPPELGAGGACADAQT